MSAAPSGGRPPPHQNNQRTSSSTSNKASKPRRRKPKKATTVGSLQLPQLKVTVRSISYSVGVSAPPETDDVTPTGTPTSTDEPVMILLRQLCEDSNLTLNNCNGNATSDGGVTSRSNGMSVSARVMYIVMPKQSSRRGDIPGYAQLVLTVTHNAASAIGQATGNTNDADSNVNANANVNVNDDAQMVISNATKAQLVASARLTLQAALETLIAKGKALNVAVELSRSQKTYRNTLAKRRDRHVGTIMKSEDYKNFLEQQKRTEEELQAKKKPTPGGENADSNGEAEKVSALVLHLKTKREAEQQAKLKKKAAKAKNKQSQSQSPTKVMSRDRDRSKTSLPDAKKKGKDELGANSAKQGAKSDSKKKRRNKKNSSRAKSGANGKAKANVNSPAVAILSVK